MYPAIFNSGQAGNMIYGGSRYQHEFLDLARTVERAVDQLDKIQDRFESIAVTGVSGLVVGSPVALLMGKALIVVRKEDDISTHSGNRVENIREIGTHYLFLDDFIASGTTEHYVCSVLYHQCKRWDLPPAIHIATYQYQYGDIVFR